MPQGQGGFRFRTGTLRLPTAMPPQELRIQSRFSLWMKLFCGSKEVEPIHPGRVPVTVSVRNQAVKMDDSTYKGAYLFPPDAINPERGVVKLEIFSSKSRRAGDQNPGRKEHPACIWGYDFDAFRRADVSAKVAGSKH